MPLHRRDIEEAEIAFAGFQDFCTKVFISNSGFYSVVLEPGGAVVKHGGLWSR